MPAFSASGPRNVESSSLRSWCEDSGCYTSSLIGGGHRVRSCELSSGFSYSSRVQTTSVFLCVSVRFRRARSTNNKWECDLASSQTIGKFMHLVVFFRCH